jgi:hypothetical protein
MKKSLIFTLLLKSIVFGVDHTKCFVPEHTQRFTLREFIDSESEEDEKKPIKFSESEPITLHKKQNSAPKNEDVWSDQQIHESIPLINFPSTQEERDLDLILSVENGSFTHSEEMMSFLDQLTEEEKKAKNFSDRLYERLLKIEGQIDWKIIKFALKKSSKEHIAHLIKIFLDTTLNQENSLEMEDLILEKIHLINEKEQEELNVFCCEKTQSLQQEIPLISPEYANNLKHYTSLILSNLKKIKNEKEVSTNTQNNDDRNHIIDRIDEGLAPVFYNNHIQYGRRDFFEACLICLFGWFFGIQARVFE